MNAMSQAFEQDHGLELRVLAGPQAGARTPLPAGAMFVIAATVSDEGEPADIVLRDGGAEPARVRITPQGSQALLEVLEGTAVLDDQPVAAGSGAIWTMHSPLRVGGATVAFGHASDTAWFDPARPAGSAGAEAGSDAPVPVAAVSRHHAPRWLISLGIAMAVGCAGLLGFVQVVSAKRGDAVQAPTLAEALHGTEFSSLVATRDAVGHLVLRGRLSTMAQRTRLDAWLTRRQFAPTMEVDVDEALARDVTSVFRVNGVTVQAHVEAPGIVVADASEPDFDRLARAQDVVRRDVPGLTRLSVVNHAVPPPPPRPPVPDDPGKRIASVVPGDPAYIVTADGSRYFLGAMLPTGDRITAIERQSVTLERDGQVIHLNL